MNSSYYETLDENFNKALELYENDYTHEDLIAMLKNGNIVQKQISALRLDTVRSFEEAKLLVENLTGQDGKIREAISFRLKEFMANPDLLNYFEDVNNYNIFLDAIIDINGNICRNIITAICNLKKNSKFCIHFINELIKLTNELIEKVNQFDLQDGKYKVNKEVFKLYWCLETIYEFSDFIILEDLKNILLQAKSIKDYTIREKTAKILSKNFNDTILLTIRDELRKDQNYYVRRF